MSNQAKETLERRFEDDLIKEMAREAQDYASCRGIVMNTKEGKLTHAPVTLLPSPIPKTSFEEAWNVAVDFNVLVDKISKDFSFIIKHLEGVTDDEFTAKLIEIYKTVHSEGIRQKATLGIHRSDYMLHAVDKAETATLKQVELNTIAASFSNLSSFVTDLHRFLLDRFKLKGYSSDSLPVNETTKELPGALAQAVKLYGKEGAVVSMIVHPGEVNTFDQRWIEYFLWEKHGVRLLRRSLEDFESRGSIDSDGHLIIDGQVVAVAYYRAGYSPDDYPTEKEWNGRLKIERSNAIKCPNIAYHLVGTKKIQQVLAVPGILESLLEDKKAIDRLRNVFVGLYSLDEKDSDVASVIEKAKKNPEKYVLKPQREGGGNNIYGEEIVKALESFSARKLSSYILMDRIMVPEIPTYLLRAGEVSKVEGVAELGIYSVFISDKDGKVVLNKPGGFLLRTKVAHVEDGGVAAGVAVLDCPYLV